MLPQEHLALPLADLLLDLRLDLLLRLGKLQLPLHVNQHPPQPFLDSARLQQRLALGRGDVDVPSYEIRKAPGLLDAFQDLLHHLLRESHLDAQLGGALANFLVQRHERRILGIERREVGRLLHHRFDVALALRVLEHGGAVVSVQQQLNATQPTLHLADSCNRPRRVEHLGLHRLHVLSLRYGEDHLLLTPQRRLDGAKRRRPPRANRCGDPGEHHRLAQREHRQPHPRRRDFWHLDLLVRRGTGRISFCHSDSCEARTVPPFGLSCGPFVGGTPFLAPCSCRDGRARERPACQYGRRA